MVAQVSFLKGYGPKKLYDYFTEVDVKAGELVVVPAGSSYSLAKVEKVKEQSAKAKLYIVQVVDKKAIKRAKELAEARGFMEDLL